ncbi:chorismate mutase / prephenate dehydratase [Candidatus Hakubella thermalkaliphila]|uniref:Chorismate mutase / prephenate dehydratase n=1 Tax=Candidatus Hakubella thermalkaliphila TaxID=2754717 RepID=A0A6V8PNC2_9ACTN|nr:chorismate mutase / prephenate dehydratase [Candidatus Hakubella thermalkaliphila]
MQERQVKEEIARLRREIDSLDSQIISVLNQRAEKVVILKKLKEKIGLPAYDPRREEEILENLKRLKSGPLHSKHLKEIYQKILEIMRALERENC